MKNRSIQIMVLAAVMAFSPLASRAQIRVNRLLASADSARLSYDFRKAEDLCRKALEVAHKDQVNNDKTDKAILISNIRHLLK